MRIKTRASLRNIKTFDRAECFSRKTKGAFSDLNRSAEQAQESAYESSVEYAGVRMQEIERKIGQTALYGSKRVGEWGVRETRKNIYKLKNRPGTVKGEIKVKSVRLPIQKKKAIKSGRKMLRGSARTARASMKTSQRAFIMMKKATHGAVRLAKITIQTSVKAIKATVAMVKDLVALIIAGGWIAVVIIIVICLLGLIIGCVFVEPELLGEELLPDIG